MNEENPFVCVVDDDSSMRESLSNLIRSAGLNVQTFASAQRVLNKPASGCAQLLGARCTAAGTQRA